jgi:hypothetical protein
VFGGFLLAGSTFPLFSVAMLGFAYYAGMNVKFKIYIYKGLCLRTLQKIGHQDGFIAAHLGGKLAKNRGFWMHPQ